MFKYKKFAIVLRLLVKAFPKCFDLEEVKILKVGIYHDIKKNSTLKSNQIASFLNEYCNTEVYKEKHVLGAPRHDLHGNIVDYVTQEQIDRSKAKNN